MSDYFLSLDPVAKQRYRQKLKIIGLDEKWEPYLDTGDYIDDMSLWPPVEFAHIFCYFIERPGLYTKQQLMQWKSLDAYNYFLSGHVRRVTVKKVNSSICVLKAVINPSQSSADRAHEAWVAAKSDGQIVAAHCKCMAGLGEGCSHVAAIMFKVESAVKNGYTSVTSNACRWNQIFTTKHEPSRIIDIDFTQMKVATAKDIKCSEPVAKKRKTVSPPSTPEKKAFIETLCNLEPKATILTATMLQDPARTTADVPLPRKLPPTVISYITPNSRLSNEKLKAECERVFGEVQVTREEADYLAASTTLQSDCLLWFEHRKGRITASYFGPVFHTRLDPPSESLLNNILQEKPIPNTPAIQWGKEKEAVARQKYVDTMRDNHIDFTVVPTGLHVNPSFPHLGASPDGIVSCSCCGKGLLEIKCPYSKREIDLQQVDDGDFYLKHTVHGLRLSKTHHYYYQIQGQLAICGYIYSDFVCWTTRGIHVERIEYVAAFFNNIRSKLDTYFCTIVLPKMIRGKDSESGEVFCVCRKGEYGKMIACDNPNCKHQWFHFKCINIRVAPKGIWFCSDCLKS